MFNRKTGARTVACAALLGTTLCPFSAALAQEDEERPIAIEASFKADLFGVASGGAERGTRYLDNLNVTVELDLESLIGWQGASAFANVLNNFGGRPNDLAGTLQGVDNIEVAETRLKLYEAWIEQAFGSGNVTLRAGLYDLNSEFYQNDATGLLIAPPFGIGSELSATGPNGPSIFPSTALAGRLNASFGDAYVRGAVVNAKAGTLGDLGGVDLTGRDGTLLIAETGWTRGGKIAIGAWRYSNRQPVIDAPMISPDGTTDISQGAYVTIEHDLYTKPGGATVHGFVRAGLSDGRTTPFNGGWQAGVLVTQPFDSRPESSFSLGVGSAYLSRAYRDSIAADIPGVRHSETVIEATYKDEIAPGVSLQPDVQYIINPGADPSLRNALVLGLRVHFDFTLR